MARISVDHLTFYYDGSFDNVFEDVSFSIDTNWKLGFIGRNGKGKTTFLNLFCAILRQLDFERVQFLKNIEDYSEGQKKKVLLAASLLTPAHLYIWDEPLNYIDVFSRMQIEKLLLDYQPTMLFVEHDVRFREKIATKTIECNMENFTDNDY